VDILVRDDTHTRCSMFTHLSKLYGAAGEVVRRLGVRTFCGVSIIIGLTVKLGANLACGLYCYQCEQGDGWNRWET
jgi:hypothetical protein